MKESETAAIVRGVLSLARRLRAERPAGAASLSAIAILATLRRRGPMTAVELAAEERLQPQSLTRLIAGLEKAGLIVRTRSPTDGRAIVITPTKQGLAALSADMRARRAWLEKAISGGLTKEQQALVLDASLLMAKLATYEDTST